MMANEKDDLLLMWKNVGGKKNYDCKRVCMVCLQFCYQSLTAALHFLEDNDNHTTVRFPTTMEESAEDLQKAKDINYIDIWQPYAKGFVRDPSIPIEETTDKVVMEYHETALQLIKNYNLGSTFPMPMNRVEELCFYITICRKCVDNYEFFNTPKEPEEE